MLNNKSTLKGFSFVRSAAVFSAEKNQLLLMLPIASQGHYYH